VSQGEKPISRQPLAELCRKALQSPDPAALEALRRHAKAILKSLGDGDEEIQKALTVDSPDSELAARVAAVYDLLAETEPSALPVDTREVLLKRNLDKEAEIGRAFKEDLLHDLKPVLRNLVLVFAAVPRISRREQRHLRQTTSVDAAWPDCAALVACGLTPLGVLDATTTPFSLARRLQKMGSLKSSEPVILCHARRSTSPPKQVVEFSRDVVREVLQVAHCSEPAAETLVDWLIDVARVKPSVFGEARAKWHEWGVQLTPDPDYSNKPLGERWHEVGGGADESAAGLPAAQPGTAALSRSGQ
jgi:hypothetical protein